MNLILSCSINYNLTFKRQMEQIILFSKKKEKKAKESLFGESLTSIKLFSQSNQSIVYLNELVRPCLTLKFSCEIKSRRLHKLYSS